MSSQRASGHCLCGAISYVVDGPMGDILQCHCEPCRRATGNFVASSRTSLDNIEISGEEKLRWHDLGFSKYGFCRECGSHMFWKAEDRPETIGVQLGCIDDSSKLRLASIWFADEAQSHNALDPDVPHYRGNGGE